MASSTPQALTWNIAQAKGLQNVLKTNIGPTGTMKMLVSGGGEIKITKDGARLLSEMQIQLPTAQLIARSAAAIDDQFGDGTCSVCLLNAELLKVSERYLSEGVHPRILIEGIKEGCVIALKVLDSLKVPIGKNQALIDGVILSTFTTKVSKDMAIKMTEITSEAVRIIKKEGEELDLHMVEIMHMKHRLAAETVLVKGLVMDHGGRHPDMPHELFNCFILIANVSLEYEKSEVNSSFSFATPEQREKLVESERKLTDDKVRRIIELKRKVCELAEEKNKGKKYSFVVINQKGIDPLSLDALAKEGILGLRRAKKRNMERLALACGGVSVNSVEELTPDVLGQAGHVYEQTLGEEKYTFVEDLQHPHSCTILVKGSTDYVLFQLKDALRDGLRAAKNAYDDGFVLPGGGAFEIAANVELSKEILKKREKDHQKNIAGIQVFADAILVIPKLLAQNSGFDSLETVVKLQEKAREGIWAGLDIDSKDGDPMDPINNGVLDNVCVKKQILTSASVIANQLLQVDDVLYAGKAGAPKIPNQ